MAVKTSESATATVKLVGATDDFSDSDSEIEDQLKNKEVHEDVKERKQVPTDNSDINDRQRSGQNGGEDSESEPRSASSSPRKERFNPFNKDNYDGEKQQFTQLRTSPAQESLNSSHSERLQSFSSDSWSDMHVSTSEKSVEITNAELGLAEDHFSQPEGHFGLSTIEELEMAIRNCKVLIFEAAEHSERRKNLVNKLVQLRMRLQKAKDGPVKEEPDIKYVVGHRFTGRDSRSSKHYCEKCSGVIWGVLQTWYRCVNCGFCCHEKCLNLITRTCASVKVQECPYYILSICPQKGLGSQNYRCAECRAQISYKSGFGEPRQCDYTGSYYCELCHWNDSMITPARVLHNWDFETRKVCRGSKQFLKLMVKKPVIRVQDINPMLFSFVEELNDVKKLREEILVMKKYFISCQAALDSKLLLQLSERQHFVDNSDMYSLQDLIDIVTDTLLPELAKIHSSFAQHIKTDCHLCQAKGYVCELCDMQEVLFPFDNHAIVCSQCSTVLHRHCYMRKDNFCPKCDRISKRAVDQSEENET